MAKPIPRLEVRAPSPEAVEDAALERLRTAVARDEEALEQALRVVSGLYDRGLLELAAAALEKGDDLLRLLVSQVSQPGALRLVNNAVALGKLGAAWDLEKLGTLLEGARAGAEEALAHPPKGAMGLFGLLKWLSDPDVSRALHALFGTLRGLGRAMDEAGRAAGREEG
ncbi:DUF1641 domain-containing protein [Alicyclobacillus sp.]|uniref:DUF1641 domain-containing protein n=1 Tax=Alicyclobacillus sp. TaxID=61169 RepID=UPI0025B9573B|nr:DUF1641 domain-containing protein [Alicyclobacillus sp.]MCL6515829.1 DUF1641 domain-containing protein [Alicyclobacillus sp.]